MLTLNKNEGEDRVQKGLIAGKNIDPTSQMNRNGKATVPFNRFNVSKIYIKIQACQS